MRQTQSSLLKLMKFKEEQLKKHGPEWIEFARDFIATLGDKQRLIAYITSRCTILSGLVQEYPEIGPPIDWTVFSNQVSSAIQSVSQSGGLDAQGQYLKFEVIQVLVTLFYVDGYLGNHLEQLQKSQQRTFRLYRGVDSRVGGDESTPPHCATTPG